MDREVLNREKNVILYGQSVRFRIVKYSVLIPLFAALYWWKGGATTLWVLGVALAVALVGHFVYRAKTNAWRSAWGGFKPLDS